MTEIHPISASSAVPSITLRGTEIADKLNAGKGASDVIPREPVHGVLEIQDPAQQIGAESGAGILETARGITGKVTQADINSGKLPLDYVKGRLLDMKV
ncbi:MAG: hypothetical protein HYS32_03760 [Candidatus Woesearchaeota archaeon]|nr:MAG: hypothetical protein HYS32_03760 [Candidatus Woesearchaeota archaeon]